MWESIIFLVREETLHQCHSKKIIIVEVLTVQNNVNFELDQDDLPYVDITCAKDGQFLPMHTSSKKVVRN